MINLTLLSQGEREDWVYKKAQIHTFYNIFISKNNGQQIAVKSSISLRQKYVRGTLYVDQKRFQWALMLLFWPFRTTTNTFKECCSFKKFEHIISNWLKRRHLSPSAHPRDLGAAGLWKDGNLGKCLKKGVLILDFKFIKELKLEKYYFKD